jgi:hypothetical protein
MFSWICPQCGREVPPSYTECPDCAAKGALQGSGPAPEPAQSPANMPPGLQPAPSPPYVTQPPLQAPAGAQPQYAPYPAQYPPPQYPPQYAAPQGQYPQYPPPQPQYQAPQPQYAPQYAPQPQYAPPPAPGQRAGLPTWLLTVAFAIAFVAVVGGIYWLVGSPRGGSQAAAPAATVDNPAAKAGAKTSSVQKYVEISAVRFSQDAKRNILVKFLVTNHSDADLSGLAGNVTLLGRTQKSEADAVGTFSFTADVPPQASKEVSVPLTTKLKIYEMPDWQNVATDVQITAPE